MNRTAKLRSTTDSSSGRRDARLELLIVAVALLVPLLACKRFRLPAGDTTGGGETPALSPPETPEPALPKSGPGSGGVVPAGERLQWADTQTLFPTRLNDDDVEDFVGGYKVLDLANSKQTLHVGAFDGATLRRIWGTPSFGTLSEGVTSTHLGLAAARFVVTDFRNRAHVLELATGRELGEVMLSDRARLVCSPGSTDLRDVWIEVADGKNVMVDVLAMTATPAKDPPPWCAGQLCKRRPAFACADGRAVPKVDGMRSDTLLVDGPDAIVIGTKTPGTPIPTAAGLTPGTSAARWQGPIPADPATSTSSMRQPAGLAAGRFVAAHEVVTSRSWRLVAFDAKTGARSWDVEIPRSSEGSGPGQLIASPTRVYVPHWTWLDVFDAANGKYVGTVGMW